MIASLVVDLCSHVKRCGRLCAAWVLISITNISAGRFFVLLVKAQKVCGVQQGGLQTAIRVGITTSAKAHGGRGRFVEIEEGGRVRSEQYQRGGQLRVH